VASSRLDDITCHAAATPARPGYVECRVAVEEADRLEHETGVVDRHDGPVLWPGEVGEPESVPEDDVGPVDVAVGLDPGVNAGEAAGILIDERA
jgi:hypothetical protein